MLLVVLLAWMFIATVNSKECIPSEFQYVEKMVCHNKCLKSVDDETSYLDNHETTSPKIKVRSGHNRILDSSFKTSNYELIACACSAFQFEFPDKCTLASVRIRLKKLITGNEVSTWV